MSYLNYVLNPENAPKTLRRGISGALVGAYLVSELKKPIVVIRKDHDNSHGSSVEQDTTIEGHSYIIVDDGISTGSTIRTIIDTLYNTYKAKLTGIFLYSQSRICSLEEIELIRIFSSLTVHIGKILVRDCEQKKSYFYSHKIS